MMHITVRDNSETLAVDVMDGGASTSETLENNHLEPLRHARARHALIRGLMDDVSIVSDQEGTVVHMEKRRAT